MEISINKETPFWQTKAGCVIRWCMFIPGAAISAAAINIFISLLWLIGDLLDGSIWLYLKHPEIISADHMFLPLINSVIFGGTFVYVGTNIAPLQKKVVPLILFGLIAATFGAIAFFACLVHEWKVLIQCLLAILSAGYVCYNHFTEKQTD